MTFISPVDLPALLRIQMRVFVHSGGLILPHYWRLGVGECREGNLVFPGDLTGIGTGTTGACQNPWAGANTITGSYQYDSHWDNQNGKYNRADLHLEIARDTPVSIVAGQRYIAGVIAFDSWSDVDSGTGACIGCATPVSMEFDVIQFFEVPGSPFDRLSLAQDDVFLDWQGGARPLPVSARNATWGAVKAFYR